MAGLSVNNELHKFLPCVPNSLWHKAHWNAALAFGFPTNKEEDWKYTSLDAFKALKLTLPKETYFHDEHVAALCAKHWQQDGYRLVIVNGKLSIRLSDWIPKVDVHSVEKHFDDLAFAHEQAIRAEIFQTLTNATAQGGLIITIPDNVQLDKPIHILHYHSGSIGEVSSVRHHLTLGQLSSCQIIEHHISDPNACGVTLSRLTSDIGNNAHFEHVKLIEEGEEQHHFGHNDIRVGRDATASSHVFMLSGKLIRHHTSSLLSAPGSHIQMNSLALPSNGDQFDSRTYLHHHAAHCSSQQLHKVIARDEASGVFDGMIYVSPDALKTDGQMDNHNLLLSDHARINSRPKLEIYADDVKCSHGATTGQIDPQQIFYLQARGINKAQAEKIITHAFAIDVCEKISHVGVRQYLSNLVNKKLEA